MRTSLVLGGVLLALTSSLALAQPESLLPDFFDDPEPTPAPAPASPTPGPVPVRTPSPSVTGVPSVPGSSVPVIQDIPAPVQAVALPEDFPSLEEMEGMDEDELNELFGLRPKFDVPPAVRRAAKRIGVIAMSEGGFPSRSLAGQPAGLVRAALEGTKGPLVSRWGHILLRRALASRLDTPAGMDPVEFAAMRASLLNRIGEPAVARALVQDVDSNEYDLPLTNAAFDAYLATGDLLGMCPVARLSPDLRNDGNWILTRAVCDAYLGEQRNSERRLDRALGTGEAPEIDVRLAQRYAGAAGEGSRAVNIEWDNVESLDLWRFTLARAVGADLPEGLLDAAPVRFTWIDATMPAVPITRRVESSLAAGELGILSSSAIVDLYSQLYASDLVDDGDRLPARVLREAYVAQDPADRLAAMENLWGDGAGYGPLVLTAYAAARLPVSEDLVNQASPVIASMLAAGLDRNALRWADLVDEGSEAWAQLALVRTGQGAQVSRGAFDSFVDDDDSADQRKSRFLLAGLAGLGRLDSGTVSDYSDRLGVNLDRQNAWSRRIDAAGQYGNQALVAMLAGVGMQGDSWERMTALHLFHIVRALDAVGLDAEARMIAAEAVARG